MGKFLDESLAEWSDDFGQILRGVHRPNQCLNDSGCTIHTPSEHHMISWPQLWRDDRGIMERVCPHEIGHPDPDEIFLDDFTTIHGCDGCCTPPS